MRVYIIGFQWQESLSAQVCPCRRDDNLGATLVLKAVVETTLKKFLSLSRYGLRIEELSAANSSSSNRMEVKTK